MSELLKKYGVIPEEPAPRVSVLEKYGVTQPQATAPEEAPGILDYSKQALGGALKALGYSAGVSRTALMESLPALGARAIWAKALGGEMPDLQQGSDRFLEALKGNAPRLKEYAREAGVGEGPSVDLPLFGKTSALEAASGVGEAILDPTNALGGGVGKNIGKWMHSLPTRELGKGVTETMFKHGITGTSKQMMNKSSVALKNLFDRREALFSTIDKAGIKGRMSRATAPGKRLASKWAKGNNETLAKAGNSALVRINRQAKLGGTKGKPKTITRKEVVPSELIEAPSTEGLQYIKQTAKPEAIIRKTTSPATVAKQQVRIPEGATKQVPIGFDPVADQITKRTVPIRAQPEVSKKVAAKFTERRVGRKAITEQASKTPWMSIKPPKVVRKTKPVTVETKLPAIKPRAHPTAKELSGVKTDMQKAVGDRAYKQGASTGAQKKLQKKVASGFQKEVERMARKVSPAAESELKQLNKEMGHFLEASKSVLPRNVKKAARQQPVSEVDLMALAYSPALFTAKQAGKVAKMKVLQTVGGKTLFNLSPAMSAGAKRFLINLQKSQEEK